MLYVPSWAGEQPEELHQVVAYVLPGFKARGINIA
jgi:hypothetical protein